MPANTEQGLISIPSAHGAAETVARLQAAIGGRGIATFAVIDHAAGAQSVGLTLSPTTVLVFGNPAAGTPFMQDRQTAGIDLPLRMLVWEAPDGSVYLTWNDPAWIAARHDLGQEGRRNVQAMQGLLTTLAREAAGREN